MILRSKSNSTPKSLFTGVSLLPSTGEWVYGTTPTKFTSEFLEEDVPENTQWQPEDLVPQIPPAPVQTNLERSLDNLRDVLPDTKWISLICSWFGTDLRLNECDIVPKTEKFLLERPGGAGGEISISDELGAWDVGANGVLTRTVYNLENTTIVPTRITDGSTDVLLEYNYSVSAATEVTINITIRFYENTNGTGLLSEVQLPTENQTQGVSGPLSGSILSGAQDIPSATKAIAVEVTRSTDGAWNDIAADRVLDTVSPPIAIELDTSEGDSVPFSYLVQGLGRDSYETPSLFWESPTEFNPVFVQFLLGRNGFTVTQNYDASVDPDATVGQPYVDPTGFEDQSAGIVLCDSGTTSTDQEAYSPWNYADGPGGNIPYGYYRWRTFVWSPVQRVFKPAARKGGPGNSYIVSPEPKTVPAKTWTEIAVDFPTDGTFSYVEFVLDKENMDQPWFYSTNTTIFSLTNPKVAYGGTPSDRSIIEGIKEMKLRGYKVLFYPFILMDITDFQRLPDPDESGPQGAYPWRGRIQPTASDQGTSAVTAQVQNFFGSCKPTDFTPDEANATVQYSGPAEYKFRRMILHYAHLCNLAGGVDAFAIATEMRGLTTARDGDHSFPAVQKLIELANDVRSILGDDTEITYACDWSEFMPRNYNTAGGFNSIWHLDRLWASQNIDFVGIDNYLPISDWQGSELAIDDAQFDSIYDIGYLKSQIEGGEGWDYQYVDLFDRQSQIRTPISEYRYRDKAHKIAWQNLHYDIKDGTQNLFPTEWVPELKRIVYTEYGCPAIDKGTNQPNKFVDPKSKESVLPFFSDGTRDDRIQQAYYQAMTEYWNPEDGNNPVSSLTGEYCIDYTMMIAWTWDARPWPAFPRFEDVWSDGANYNVGHWLQGRSWIEAN